MRSSSSATMLAVNLGTRGIQEAVNLLEYCNIESGTRLSDLRREHGTKNPHNVRMWCLGNEMDGPWQVGHRSAVEYGRLAAQTARAMRMVDPKLELVVCGKLQLQHAHLRRLGAERAGETYDEVDYISAHAYYEEHEGDKASFLASAVDMDYFIADEPDAVTPRPNDCARVDNGRAELVLPPASWTMLRLARQ